MRFRLRFLLLGLLLPMVARADTVASLAVPPGPDGTSYAARLGARCDGTTDDAAALNAAGAAIGNRGGGTLVITGRCLVAGGNLVVPNNVTIRGEWYPGGQRGVQEYAALAGAIVLDPARTIAMGSGSRLANLAITRRGLTRPADMRGGIQALAAFAGTAVTVSGAQDVSLQDLLILGCDRAVDTLNSQRVRLRDVYFDCNNGPRIVHSHDISRLESVHGWAFLTTNMPWTFTDWAVSAAADNGAGQVRVTTATPHALQTGDTANVSVPGVLAPAFVTVTAVDGTHLDLQGTRYAGRLAGPGFVTKDLTRRPGRAFEVLHSESTEIVNSFGFGFVGGIHLGDGAGWTHLINVSNDNYLPAQDPGTFGLVIDGTAYGTSMVGGVLTSAATEVLVNSTGQEGHSLAGVSINPANGRMIQVLAGRLTLTGNHGPAAPASAFVADGGFLDMSGNTLPGLVLTYQSPAAQARTMLAGNTLAVGQPVLQLPNNARTGIGLTVNDGGGIGAANINLGGCPVLSGAGSPAGRVAAPPCTLWLRTDGAAGATLYVKEAGTGTAGWAAK